MKTYKNLFTKICSFENLYLAYLKARKYKRYKSYVLEFSFNLENNLLTLQRDLMDGTYRHNGYQKFIVYDSKKRIIKAPSFRDRVVHHALCNIIEPIFDRGFIYDSYACRRKKGTHRAVKRLGYFLQSLSAKLQKKAEEHKTRPRIYCLKCDISKYFESIDHEILFYLLQKKIGDQEVLILLKKIIDSTPGGKGIPIGNLTSQLFANIYLNELDQFIKHRLRIEYYIRYVDDFLILDFYKPKLRQTKELIRNFLQEKLKLELHPVKARLFPIDKGIDFLGYTVFNHYKLLRKSTVKRFIKRMGRCREEIAKGKTNRKFLKSHWQSWLGYASFANSWKLRRYIQKRLTSIIYLLNRRS